MEIVLHQPQKRGVRFNKAFTGMLHIIVVVVSVLVLSRHWNLFGERESLRKVLLPDPGVPLLRF